MREYSIDFGDGLQMPRGQLVRVEQLPDGSRVDNVYYRYNRDRISLLARRELPAVVADLYDVAVAVGVADRVACRFSNDEVSSGGRSGSRKIRVRIPVRCPETWASDRLSSPLRNALLELTNDVWEFEFCLRETSQEESARQRFLEIPSALDDVSSVFVHSGGLDSLAGVLRLIEGLGRNKVVLASVSTNKRLTAVQVQTAARLSSSCRLELKSGRLEYGLTSDFPRNERDSSQRARAFVFLIHGAAIAHLAGLDEVIVFENGIGAIGLPYTLDQVGVRSNRSMHPFTLHKMGLFVSELFGCPFRFVNLGLWDTKASAISKYRSSEAFRSAAPFTVTCDRFPRYPRNRACGVCTSCLLRRIALRVAGIESIDRHISYEHDVFDVSFAHQSLKVKVPLTAMKLQVEHVRRLLASHESPDALTDAFPELELVKVAESGSSCTREEIDRQIRHLYASYVKEWDAVDWPSSNFASVSRIDWLGLGGTRHAVAVN